MAKKIVIVGGGTAGWMAANMMAKRWLGKGFTITLVESADIDTIGVGEGSTPFLQLFFEFLDIPEQEWMPACNATYKASIEFANWSTRPGFEAYSHPFPSALDDKTTPVFMYNTLARRQGANIPAHPDRYLLGAHIAKKHCTPVPDYNFPFAQSYGYHFDSNKLGQFLRDKGITQGVKRIEDNIVDVVRSNNGELKSLKSQSHGTFEADMFIDCTGFAALLIGQHLKVPFVDYADNLFNDRALALATPIDEQVPSQTTSTALKNGWAWKIPLTNRFGNGYVYSSKYCSDDEAEAELRQHTNTLNSDTDARLLKFQLGRREQAWHKNCVAIGLSQGFIEPLEATAIDLIQRTIQSFIDAYESVGFDHSKQNDFNKTLNYRYERVRDYIVMHYNLNTRDDTDYWRDARAITEFSPESRAVHECWMTGNDIAETLNKQKLITFDKISWHCLFAGMGIFPNADKLRHEPSLEKYDLEAIDEFIKRCSLNFKNHSEALKQLV